MAEARAEMSGAERGARGPRLPRSFFEGSAVTVARELIGKLLVRVEGRRLRSGTIVEAEAYVGEADTACHAARGRTPRPAVMYGPPGHAYVYFTYGMHWMLNVVAEPEGTPAAVLIRALEPVEGIEEIRAARGGRPDRDLTSGPARVCAALGIDGRLNGADLAGGRVLFIEAGWEVPPDAIASGPRVGIDYAAAADRAAAWRFWLDGNPHISRGRPSRR